MRKCAPVRIIIYAPRTPEGKTELSRRVAQVHADMVIQRIREWNCPAHQKLQLVDAVIHTVMETTKSQLISHDKMTAES